MTDHPGPTSLTGCIKSEQEPIPHCQTHQSYEGAIRLHLKPTLGALRLTALRADHLQVLYSERLAAGKSKRTVQLAHAVIRHALDDALKWGLVARNIADAVTAPRPNPKEMTVWTPEQARAFLDGVATARNEALYRLALSCGLRVGEILGLRWEDVDLEAGRLHVRRTVQRLGKGTGTVIGEPKTAKGRRQVVMPAAVVDALRRWKVRQLEERLLAGTRWTANGHVFTSRVGTVFEARKLQDDFARHVDRINDKAREATIQAGGDAKDAPQLPRIRLHDLRHTCATLLLSRGVHPKIVQEMLGHSQIAMTMDTYSHVLPTMQEEAANAMERLLGSITAASSP